MSPLLSLSSEREDRYINKGEDTSTELLKLRKHKQFVFEAKQNKLI